MEFTQLSSFAQGIIASLVAGLVTSVGGLISLYPVQYIEKYYALLLGFCGGVMLAATTFSLILPGIEYAASLPGYTRSIAAGIMAIGMLLGWQALRTTHHFIDIKQFFPEHSLADKSFHRIWLFILAITIHNFPEGMAVGVSFGDGALRHGLAVSTGIALQNIPEGLAVSLALIGLGYSRRYAFGIALLTGLVEPLGGIVGAGFVALSVILLPWGMAFAAGAMLTVITEEIIPESHAKSVMAGDSTLGLMFGFLLMMFLDISLS